MKFEDTKIARRWRAYAGPRDERLEAENCRIYRVGFWLLSVGMLLFLLYGMMEAEVALNAAVKHGGPAAVDLDIPWLAMLAWFLAVMVIVSAMQSHRGFIETNRFSQTDTFPAGYCSLMGGIAGAVLAIVSFAMRSAAQAQLLGADGVNWAGNLAGGVVAGLFCWALTLLLHYLQFRHAKRNRARIEDEL